MEGLLIDTFRVILGYLDAKDLCLIATVNKKWCYEANSAALWRDLFLILNEKFFKSNDKDKQFYELVRTTTVPQIYNDWKRAYIVKSKYKAAQSRVWCLSECAVLSGHQTPQLDAHNMGPFAHQPMMFEQFATKLVNYTDPPSTAHKRHANDDDPCKGLFQQVCKTLGDDLSRAWMIVDASRAEGLTNLLGMESNAIFTTLMGSFFNLTNVHNFPYLVKVDSCLTFCEHVYDTSGGNWCYLMVEHPSLQNLIDSVWYLNCDANLYPTKEMKTMAFLRRHFMKFYTWYDNFFRLGELHNIIMMLHIYEQSVRDELFYEILLSPINNYPIRTPIVDYYILIDDKKKFFSEKIAVVSPNFVPIKVGLNGKKEDQKLLSEYVTLTFLWRAETCIKQSVPGLEDSDLIPKLRELSAQAKSHGFTSERDHVTYFLWYYVYPSFTENPLIKEILENRTGEHNTAARVKLIQEIVGQLIAPKEDGDSK